jgi:hypothetical protein
LGNKRERSVSAKSLAGYGNGKTFATLGTTTLDHESAVFCRHADKKAMGALPGSITWLKGSFHLSAPCFVSLLFQLQTN